MDKNEIQYQKGLFALKNEQSCGHRLKIFPSEFNNPVFFRESKREIKVVSTAHFFSLREISDRFHFPFIDSRRREKSQWYGLVSTWVSKSNLIPAFTLQEKGEAFPLNWRPRARRDRTQNEPRPLKGILEAWVISLFPSPFIPENQFVRNQPNILLGWHNLNNNYFRY